MEGAGDDTEMPATTDETMADEANEGDEASIYSLLKAQLDSWRQRKRGLQPLPFAAQNFPLNWRTPRGGRSR